MFSISGLLTYAVIMAFTPGPNNITSMSNASKLGLKKSIQFNFGVLVGFSILMWLSALFGTVLASVIPNIKFIMQIVGAAYMLYLAWNMLRSTGEINENSKGATFFNGLTLQFVNPKAILYGITVMSNYILPYFNNMFVILGLGLLLAGISFIATVCWALFGTLFKKLFTNHAKVLNVIMALLLVYCAVSLFL